MRTNMNISESVAGDWQELHLRDGQKWSFLGGGWLEHEEGLISPPKTGADENLAVYTPRAFADFEVDFEFRWNNLCCGGGFAFRAQDARHYYLIEFPCTGQQYRAEYFWACISKVDDTGWAKVLKTEIVPGVPSEIGMWHKCRLLARGNEIRLWVDGRPFPVVCDNTYNESGHIGLYSYDGLGNTSPLSFRNVRVRGQEHKSIWDASVQPVQNWFYPTLEETYGKVHHLSSITRAPNGDLLMKLSIGNEFHGQQWTPVLIRSSDNGRAWSAQQKLDDRLMHGMLHTTRDGRLLMMEMKTEQPFTIRIAMSEDNGVTWSEFRECGRVDFSKEVDIAIPNQLLELKDGTLVWFMYRHITRVAVVPDYGNEHQHDYGSYCIRSTDGGMTWSKPVNLDGPKPSGFERFMMIKKHFGSETSAAQTRDGKVLAFVRPYYDPVMWETWSTDSGQSWTPAARGPFGMWAATCSMLSTTSGVLLIAGRHPGLAFQLSYDDGMTWECYRFDTTFWANGFTSEIEPNVVMYASTAKYGDPHVRVHLFRITPEGPEPMRYS